MKPLLLLAALLATPIAFTSCASVTQSTVAFSEEGFRDQNDVIIYVYRVRSLVGAAVPWNLRLDGKIVAVLRQNSYAVLHTTPGVHTILVGDQTSTNLIFGPIPSAVLDTMVEQADVTHGTFNTRPNERYYFRSQGFSVKVLSQDEAMGELSTMKFDMGV
jgi:hypothetical protein